jgi:hypothetical protein
MGRQDAERLQKPETPIRDCGFRRLYGASRASRRIREPLERQGGLPGVLVGSEQ